jgi:hypothetical protein
MQSTSHLLLIKPVKFAFNAETAVNNSFQSQQATADAQARAVREFESLAEMLLAQGVDLTVIEDTPEPHTPDSVFPNNWISFHENGKAYLYPMFASNRRLERKQHVIDAIRKKFDLKETIDLSGHENDNRFLEGTGSMVLDRDNRIAYACLSPRTDSTVLQEFCALEKYSPVPFTAVDNEGQPIYHTNVMMCVADRFVVACLDSIPAPQEKEALRAAVQASGKELVLIDMDQLAHFAGNMLQVLNTKGEALLVMSTQAYKSLTAAQLAQLEKYNPVFHSDITTIETNGGGSVRCMLAEIFLAPNKR